MNGYRAALWGEALKARRARVLLVAALAFMLLPGVGGLFMVILKDPGAARQLGLISAKAQITAGSADWPTYMGLLSQGMAVGGLLLFGVAASWIFGREYADRTAKDLLALPTSRAAIVMAKFTVLGVWGLALAAALYALAVVIGSAVGLPLWSSQMLVHSGVNLAVTTLLTMALLTPVALCASAGRGYLPGMGFAILTLFLAQVVAVTGWGGYFPWAVPALYSAVSGQQANAVGLAGYVVVVITGLAGMSGTLAWWQKADQTS